MMGMIGDLIQHRPRLAALCFATALGVTGLLIWELESTRPEREAEQAAWWKAKMECRKAGGQYEYFGPQGYVCVGGKK